MKRKMLCFIVVLLLLMEGCQGEKVYTEDNSMQTFAEKKQENMKFMKEAYGFTEDELQGINIEKLINDYQLHTRDYTTEDIREILKDQGDAYREDGSTEIFYILSVEGRTLTDEDEISSIGFYCNSGTFVQKAVFDLRKGIIYVDTPTSHDLSEAEVDLLKSLPRRWDISAWEQRTEGKEEPSTGNYDWRLAFELSNGDFAVYSGYTQDMTNLPDHFENVRDELQSIIKEIY